MYDSVLVAAFGGVTMNLDGSDELHVHPGILFHTRFDLTDHQTRYCEK